MNLAFSTTACLRPELLEITYGSLLKYINIDLKNFDLIINIDPSPQNRIGCQKQILNICNSYFGNVVYRFPAEPNFCDAVKWCWSFDYDFLFHIEDDWEFINKIDLYKILSLFNENVYQVSLKVNEVDFPRFYRLTPSIFSKKFYKKYSQYLNIKYNPEQQIGYPTKETELLPVSPKSFIIYSDKIAIKDTGRQWRKDLNIKKPNEIEFISWNYN